jgi:hypothetical protein
MRNQNGGKGCKNDYVVIKNPGKITLKDKNIVECRR